MTDTRRPAPRRFMTLLIVLLALAGLTACGDGVYTLNYQRECDVRFSYAKTGADSLAIIDKPQGPRGIYCGAYLRPKPNHEK